MFEKLPLDQSWSFHNNFSLFMFIVIFFITLLGYYLQKKNNSVLIRKISYLIILFCICQEFVDYFHRAFLDPSYSISWQKDLPLHFCHFAFYFSLFAIYLKFHNNFSENEMSTKSIRIQFFFDAAFILGMSGALQGIFTPDFKHIHNYLGIICAQLQHSLIILNVFWLMSAYKMRLKFHGAVYTYIFINLLVPFAILLNIFLGTNASGDFSNYLYIMELPNVDNFLLDFVLDKTFPNFILYVQPLIIFYILVLYLPFFLLNRFKK